MPRSSSDEWLQKIKDDEGLVAAIEDRFNLRGAAEKEYEKVVVNSVVIVYRKRISKYYLQQVFNAVKQITYDLRELGFVTRNFNFFIDYFFDARNKKFFVAAYLYNADLTVINVPYLQFENKELFYYDLAHEVGHKILGRELSAEQGKRISEVYYSALKQERVDLGFGIQYWKTNSDEFFAELMAHILTYPTDVLYKSWLTMLKFIRTGK